MSWIIRNLNESYKKCSLSEVCTRFQSQLDLTHRKGAWHGVEAEFTWTAHSTVVENHKLSPEGLRTIRSWCPITWSRGERRSLALPCPRRPFCAHASGNTCTFARRVLPGYSPSPGWSHLFCCDRSERNRGIFSLCNYFIWRIMIKIMSLKIRNKL